MSASTTNTATTTATSLPYESGDHRKRATLKNIMLSLIVDNFLTSKQANQQRVRGNQERQKRGFSLKQLSPRKHVSGTPNGGHQHQKNVQEDGHQNHIDLYDGQVHAENEKIREPWTVHGRRGYVIAQ